MPVADLSSFAVTDRWPAEHPDRIQLYSLNTPNGVKVSIMLEELGLPYEAHLIDIGADDQKTPAFLSLNPNGKIPAILDPDGPGGQPIALFESGAILLYLAEKTGRLLGDGPVDRWHATQWVMWQMGGAGPMFGQLGFFAKFAGKDWKDKRPRDRYATESKRLLGVLDRALDGQEWLLRSGYSVADIALIGWVNALVNFYKVGELVDFASHAHVTAWLERALARPAVQRGLKIPARG
jgi:GSH-dependent disulfide-bond oxidoreductase